MNLSIKRGWLVVVAIIILLIITNPGYNAFKEFTGMNGHNAAYLHKKVNGLVFSVYEDSEDEKLYAGFCLNFIDITPKEPKPPSAQIPVQGITHDTLVLDSKFPNTIQSVDHYNEDGLPVFRPK